EQERKEERREGRDLENRETDKENREILDGNGGQTARYLEQWETVNIKDFIQLGFTLQLQDNLSINNLQCQLKIKKFRGKEEEAREYKIILEEKLKENIVIPIRKNNYYTYRAMPFETKHSPIYFTTAMEPIMQQIRMKTEIRIINYIDDILFLHQNQEYLMNMIQQVINTLKYFGFTMNMEKSGTEPNQTVIFLGWEWNLANATVKTKPKKRLFLLHDLCNMRRWIKTGTEITVKPTAKLIGKLNYLRLQFQEASLFLNKMDHQKAQTARLRG
ncbi:MAG: hypothetical protein EZS28_040331, partial [Streblomastix strix]